MKDSKKKDFGQEKEAFKAPVVDIPVEEVPEEDELPVIALTDEQGHESYFLEEMVLDIGKKQIAFLTPFAPDDCCDDPECSCHEHAETEEEEDYVIVARIEYDEEGEPYYTEPTDAEYKAAMEAYNQLLADEEP